MKAIPRHSACEGCGAKGPRTAKSIAVLGPELSRYPESREIVESASTRDGVVTGLYGSGIGLGVLAAAVAGAGNSVAQEEGFEAALPVYLSALGIVGSGLVFAVAGAITSAVWDPAEDLDEAYNTALQAEIDAAYAARPTIPTTVISAR